jgi:hypothetical protein
MENYKIKTHLFLGANPLGNDSWTNQCTNKLHFFQISIQRLPKTSKPYIKSLSHYYYPTVSFATYPWTLHQSHWGQGKVTPQQMKEQCPQLHIFQNPSTGPAILKIPSLNTLLYILMSFPSQWWNSCIHCRKKWNEAPNEPIHLTKIYSIMTETFINFFIAFWHTITHFY